MKYSDDIDLKKAWKHFLTSPYENWVILLDFDEIERQRLWASRVDEPDGNLTLPDVGSPAHEALRDAAKLYRDVVELDHRRAVENGLLAAEQTREGRWRIFTVGPLGIFCVAQMQERIENFCSAYRRESRRPVIKRLTRLQYIARGLDKLKNIVNYAQDDLSAIPNRDVLTTEDMVRLRSYMADRLAGSPVCDEKYERMLTALFDGDSPEARRRIELATRNERTGLLRGSDRP